MSALEEGAEAHGVWKRTGAEPQLSVIVLVHAALCSGGEEQSSWSMITSPPEIPTAEIAQSIQPVVLTLG